MARRQVICAETGEVVCSDWRPAALADIFKAGRVYSHMLGATNAVITVYSPTLELKGVPVRRKAR